MDDGSTLYQRRQWISQYQTEKMNELGSAMRDRPNRIPFRIAFSQDTMKYILSHPKGTILSLAIIALIALNFNQGPNLSDYMSSQKIHHSDNTHGALRTLGAHTGNNCKKTPFVTPQEAAYQLPLTPPWYSNTLPSHIALCDELIKRNDLAKQRQAEQQQEGGLRPPRVPFTKFTVHETIPVCTDWSKPHSAILQLISSSIVAYVGERFGLEYKHDCHNVLNAEYSRTLPFDVTTVQQIFPNLKMPVNQGLLSLGEVVHDLCHRCMEEYHENKGAYGVYDKTHHCLAFPNVGGVKIAKVTKQIKDANGMPEMLESEQLVDSKGNVFHTAMEAVLPLVRNRLWHQARDWQQEAHIPRGDPKTGVVIVIDAGTTMPVPFQLFTKYVPQHATRIDILSGPTCASGKLAMSMSNYQTPSCLEYGTELREYLYTHFRDYAVEVTFSLLSSTAASFSRMIQTNTLICPPETMSCLLPALAKERIKNTVIFESPSSSTYDWYSYLGGALKNIQLIKLTHEQMAVDSEQQFIEAKFAGFSAAQVVGGKPKGFQRTSPVMTETSVDSEINAKIEGLNSLIQSSSTTPQRNPVVDTVVKEDLPVDVDSTGRTETGNLFDKGAIIESEGGETNVDSYLEKLHGDTAFNYATSMTDSNEQPQDTPSDVSTERTSEGTAQVTSNKNHEETAQKLDEYMLVESNVPRTYMSQSNSNMESNQVGETDVKIDHNAIFEDNSRTQAETNLLFDSNQVRSNNAMTKSNRNDGSGETDVDINYKSLFGNW